MELRIGERYVAITASNTRVFTFVCRTQKDITFFEQMRRRINVTFVKGEV